jgi:hypothetical protein
MYFFNLLDLSFNNNQNAVLIAPILDRTIRSIRCSPYQSYSLSFMIVLFTVKEIITKTEYG